MDAWSHCQSAIEWLLLPRSVNCCSSDEWARRSPVTRMVRWSICNRDQKFRYLIMDLRLILPAKTVSVIS